MSKIARKELIQDLRRMDKLLSSATEPEIKAFAEALIHVLTILITKEEKGER